MSPGSSAGTVERAVEGYLAERRALGFQMNGSELRRFARHADGQGHAGPLDTDLQVSWARLHVRRTSAGTGTRRLQTLRPFVNYYRQFEPASAIVEPTHLGPVRGRPTPHIYTSVEIDALVQAASEMVPTDDALRPSTYATLFGLLAATGMRLSETLALLDDDIAPDGTLLTIRLTKFRKTRQLPLHPSTAAVLVAYRRSRDRHWPSDPGGPFFKSCRGAVLPSRTVHSVFDRLRDALAWTARGDHAKPRLHDLRHTFAVRRVLLWHEQGTPIEQAMFWLCTYLGHAKISDTYWYLTGVPELMAAAGSTFEMFAAESGAES